MFWGCFAGRQRGPLTTLRPDEERTGKKGITAEIILSAYQEHLPEMLENCDRVFMHDNACVHAAKVVID